MSSPGFTWRRLLRRLVISGVVFISIACVVWAILSKTHPDGIRGPEADRVAEEMLRSVNWSAWKGTGAVQFTFLGHHHLWDRRRNYDRVQWGKRTVLLRIHGRTGRVWENGSEVHGAVAERFVQKAYEMWINDSFWLNPVVKLFDSGATRSIVNDDKKGTLLLVEYASGGLTPGDAYLWIPGQNGSPPSGWRMWARQLKIKGLSASWEGWTTLSTGAKISTMHRIVFFKLEMKDVAGAKTLAELINGAEDPFKLLNAL